jgi:catechol 2,3-dioxygenase-like lactoylglutathione lyase family enzyme
VPESHAGRLFDHVGLHVADVEASKRFYAAALAPLGLGITGEGEGWFSADELFVGGDGPITSGLHVAFQAQDRETVDAFYAAAIAATALRVKGRITRATTVPTSSTRMARMSRLCTTGR